MNDIFISYRRHHGEAWAAHVKELLEKRGVRCYLDKHKKRTVDFKESLLRNINQSNNFLLVLSEGVFEKREDETDWVRDEIAYAHRNNKNIIAVIFNGYDPSQVKWSEEIEDVAFLETLECLKFDDTNVNLRDASINTILEYMVDETGKPWKPSSINNNNWYGDVISEEDRLWMTTSSEVCKKIDFYAMSQMLKNPVFKDLKEVNYFSFMAYDVDCLYKKVDSSRKSEEASQIKVNTYGFCHKYDLNHANDLFGENHFEEFSNENDFEIELKRIMQENKIKYFDIIDMTLVLKDIKYPEKVLRKIVKYLNPNGSALYIRDLDDDLVVAYPDEKGYIKKLIELLALDPGAGNRHFGQKIYTYLNRSGAEEIFMVDASVTTANCKVNVQRKICDAYFSYLLPEFRQLVKDYPENDEYIDALNWLEHNYSFVESMFESKEFYFRAGYISGYGIYKDDDFGEF